MQISCRDFIPPKFYTSSKSEFYLSGTESTTLFSIHRIIKRCSRQFLEENRFQPTRYSLSRQHINFLKDNRRNSEIKSERCVFFFSLFDNRYDTVKNLSSAVIEIFIRGNSADVAKLAFHEGRLRGSHL